MAAEQVEYLVTWEIAACRHGERMAMVYCRYLTLSKSTVHSESQNNETSRLSIRVSSIVWNSKGEQKVTMPCHVSLESSRDIRIRKVLFGLLFC